MAKFKPGDRVIAVYVDGRTELALDGEYTISAEVTPGVTGMPRVKLVELPEYSYLESRFKLAPEANGCALSTRSALELDPRDPFEAVLIRMVQLNRAKRADYTTKGASAWENFDITEARLARRFGLTEDQVRGMAVDLMLFTKDTRLDALTSRGEAQNEPAEDTIIDMAVYSVIRYGRVLYPDGIVPDPENI